jgi:hypothetical protein
MWQQVIVYCIVVIAVLHMGSKYLPASWRRRIAAALIRRWPALESWLTPKAGCGGGCSSCGACDSAPQAPAELDQKARVIKLQRRR